VSDNATLHTHTLMPVSSFRQGASPYGVLQMAGNAWEYVDELITPGPGALEEFAKILSPPPSADEPWYTMRGGSYDKALIENVTFDSQYAAVPARYRAPDIGFRCAKDVP
jgi:formylglycine-generating enzyme required for sulfatase activity